MKKIVVIGQGFVGFPMSVVLSECLNNKKRKIFNVIGLEANNIKGRELVNKINNKILPIITNDRKIKKKFLKNINKNYKATTDTNIINNADIIMVSVSFNFNKKNDLKNLLNLTTTISKKIKKGTLILFETTLPPGTCQKLILPIIKKNITKNKIKLNEIYFAYSYERVTPGKNYYNSITSFPRNYSGMNDVSKKRCKNFLLKFIKKKSLLYEQDTLTDCEAAKILENSFRSINISLIDEWVKFSNISKINLKNIIESIKFRSTHSNIMSPGLGVGGYCLTKDPKFLPYSSKMLFKKKNKFPFINLASKINNNMPNTSIEYIKNKFGKLKNRKILIIGFTYKEDVADFRSSPSIIFAKKLIRNGAKVSLFDPYSFAYKNESKLKIVDEYKLKEYDIVAICVKHKDYKKKYLNKLSLKPCYFDLNNIYTSNEIMKFIQKKYKFFQLGSN